VSADEKRFRMPMSVCGYPVEVVHRILKELEERYGSSEKVIEAYSGEKKPEDRLDRLQKLRSSLSNWHPDLLEAVDMLIEEVHYLRYRRVEITAELK
jgi:hypothetical protein